MAALLAAQGPLSAEESTAASSADASASLLGSGAIGQGASESSTAGSNRAAGYPDDQKAKTPSHVIILTHVLPDGLGDLIFGENAVQEMLRLGPVAWFRCYASEENFDAGEKLVHQTASSLFHSHACSNKGDGLAGALATGQLQSLWVQARERFLAPWIFGLSTHEEALLRLAKSTSTQFWAMTEYGRGMGNIHTYTQGLGAMIPTGWPEPGEAGAVFKSILAAERTQTDWRRKFAELCGVADPSRIRMWWLYSRKDDEKKHDFRVLGRESLPAGTPEKIRGVAKVIPVGDDFNIITDANEKTSGEKLAEQLFQASSDPNFKPNLNVACAEVAAGCAAQLSQFLWGILLDPAYLKKQDPGVDFIDVVVAPNVFTRWREVDGDSAAVAQVVQFDLMLPTGRCQELRIPKGRQIFICSTKVPREEMRSFLEQCEERVCTTGDQSLAEAMLLERLPCIRPDAKVKQWQLALLARATGTVENVADLGAKMRNLVEDERSRQEARRQSEERSKSVEQSIIAQLQAPPNAWNQTHQVLARAGMLG